MADTKTTAGTEIDTKVPITIAEAPSGSPDTKQEASEWEPKYHTRSTRVPSSVPSDDEDLDSQPRSFFGSVRDWLTGRDPSKYGTLPFEQRTYGLPGSINSLVGTVKAVAPTLETVASAMGHATTIAVGLGVAAETLKSFTGRGGSDAAGPEPTQAVINLFTVAAPPGSFDEQSKPLTVGASPFAAWSHFLTPSVVV